MLTEFGGIAFQTVAGLSSDSSSIAVFCVMFTTILQGAQIDTDHWRQFYWMLGLTWGLYAASLIFAARPARA